MHDIILYEDRNGVKPVEEENASEGVEKSAGRIC